METELPPEARETIQAIRETCQPSRVSVLYAGGARKQNRAYRGRGVGLCAPGGGITFYVDVEQVRAGAFSWTPPPAIIAPIENTMLLKDYEAMGGHVEAVKPFSRGRGAVFRQKGLRINNKG
jgi:hypothetical protein